MRSRPEIFVSLIGVIVVVAAVLGFTVFQHSQKAGPRVAEQTRLYEQQKQNRQAELQPESTTDPQAASVTPLSEEPTVTGDDQTNLEAQDTVEVFFSRNPESNDDNSAVFPVTRSTNGKPPGNVAISELVVGPNSEEKAEGYVGGLTLSGTSNCNRKDFILKESEQDKVIELRFCRKVTGNDKLDEGQLQAQLVATLTHLTGAETILAYDQDNNCLFATKDKQLTCRVQAPI